MGVTVSDPHDRDSRTPSWCWFSGSCHPDGGGRIQDRQEEVQQQMTEKNVWLVTGAGRGLGVDIAKAALAAGHAVVATARNTDSITRALGEHDDLLAVALDVTDPSAAEAAVRASGRPVRSPRRAGQQRRQLPGRVLRGDDP